MRFNQWFTTFLEEKGVDMSEYCKAGDGSMLQYGDVCSAILSAPAHEQDKIKKMVVLIDFKNKDIGKYIEHLALALNSSFKLGVSE